MIDTTRRRFLQSVGIAGTTGLTGCLRMTDNGSQNAAQSDSVPENVGQLSVDVTIQDGLWQFVYRQEEVSSTTLLLPANHIAELRTTGESRFPQTFTVPALGIELRLFPDEKASQERFIPEGLVGESYDAYATEFQGAYTPEDTLVKILQEDEFERRIQNS